MPDRVIVTKELADLLSALAHPHRIRIIEELREGEKDVNCLQDILGISHSGVSQHLSILRARRLVAERREGRHVFYRLKQPALARWLVEGIALLQENQEMDEDVRAAMQKVRAIWSDVPIEKSATKEKV